MPRERRSEDQMSKNPKSYWRSQFRGRVVKELGIRDVSFEPDVSMSLYRCDWYFPWCTTNLRRKTTQQGFESATLGFIINLFCVYIKSWSSLFVWALEETVSCLVCSCSTIVLRRNVFRSMAKQFYSEKNGEISQFFNQDADTYWHNTGHFSSTWSSVSCF